jgi:HEPN domain-containing protein
MKNKVDHVRGWLAKAAGDLVAASTLLEGNGPYDIVCFHAQQAVEKTLKAYLAFSARPIPKTHDLEELQRLTLEIEPLSELAELDLAEITDYAVAVRYDLEFWPDQKTAAEALALAEQVQLLILEILPPECHV